MSDKLRIVGIICITILVITALVVTAVVTLGVGTEAAIDTAFVLSGITGIASLAAGLIKKGGDHE